MIDISSGTRLLGVIGHPIAHSLSPLFQNAALSAAGLPYVYLAFDVLPEQLVKALGGMQALGIRGFNLTLPHKEAVVPFLDELTQEAKVIGAVNTVVNREGKLIGYNTDPIGFVRSVETEKIDLAGKKVLLLGAGGVSRAIVYALWQKGVGFIFVVNRTPERAQRLASWAKDQLFLEIQVGNWESLLAGECPFLQEVEIVINATSLGLKGEEIFLPWDKIPNGSFLMDIVYRPGETPLVQQAKKRSWVSFDGKKMLIYQGAASFELFTGKPAPLEAMARALKDIS
ncbi:MAG: shikimate dehydrogenase [Candidatus Atribacteria bacterium]|nr:shikimate dehydrogenase [Candidatus Atribacteria bacterium]